MRVQRWDTAVQALDDTGQVMIVLNILYTK